MKKILSALIWTSCFLVLLVACDQFLLRYPGSTSPLLNDFQRFYRDFRSRLIQLDAPVNNIEQVIERHRQSPSSTPASHAPVLQYVYADENGALNFAGSLDDIPAALRGSAQPLTTD